MFDVGWIEMAVIALIALVVIGPKELPKAMRSLAKWTRKARGMAREFQSGIDDMVREADLEEAKKAVQSAKTFDFAKAMEDTVDPTGGLRDEAKEFQDEMAREAADPAGGDAGAEALAGPEDAAADTTEDGPEDAAADTTEDGPEDAAADTTEDAAAGAAENAAEDAAEDESPHGITPPDSVTPPEPEPATATADGGDAKQRA